MSKLLIPNTCQVPNVLLDEVMPRLPGSALKVMLAVVRKTYGFQKRSDKISFKTLQKLTGLSRDAVNQGIKALGPLLIIMPGRKNVPTSDGVNEYALNLNIETGELVRKADQSENLTSQKNPEEPVRKSDSSKPNISKPNNTGAKAPESFSTKRSRKATPPDAATLASFETFYQAYPRHVGKQDALRAWIKLAPDTPLMANE
jgi:phage replication O-like protein O